MLLKIEAGLSSNKIMSELSLATSVLLIPQEYPTLAYFKVFSRAD